VFPFKSGKTLRESPCTLSMPSLSEARVIIELPASNSKLSYLEKHKKQRQDTHTFRLAMKHMTHTQCTVRQSIGTKQHGYQSFGCALKSSGFGIGAAIRSSIYPCLFSTLNHSFLISSTGLVIVAFIVCKLSVTKATNVTMRPDMLKIQMLSSILFANRVNH